MAAISINTEKSRTVQNYLRPMNLWPNPITYPVTIIKEKHYNTYNKVSPSRMNMKYMMNKTQSALAKQNIHPAILSKE